jgi:glutaminyl-tRNA synthetase
MRCGRFALKIRPLFENDRLLPAVKQRESDQVATAQQSIKAANERLATVRFGLADMADPNRARTGLYNAVVFGRMVTFALQNMTSSVPEFDDWYELVRAELKADPLMNFFWNLRTEIEKTTGPEMGSYAHIKRLNTADVRKLPKPPGAVSFFIGDNNGGSRWEVQTADGSIEKYYVDLPPEWGADVGVTLPKLPPELRNTPTRELVSRYLDQMASIIERAKKRFEGSSSG